MNNVRAQLGEASNESHSFYPTVCNRIQCRSSGQDTVGTGAHMAQQPFIISIHLKSANLLEALQNRGSSISTLNALLYWSRRAFYVPCAQLTHRLHVLIAWQQALRGNLASVILLQCLKLWANIMHRTANALRSISIFLSLLLSFYQIL